MKIAIINLITQTVNSSPNILNTVSFPKPYAESDEEINIVELGKELSKNGQDVTIYASDAFRPANSMINKIFRLSVIYLPTRFTRLFPYSYLPFTPSLYGELLSNEYDIVQSGEFLQIGTIISSLVSSKRKLPMVIWHELGVRQRFPGSLIQQIYAKTLGKYVIKKTVCFIPRSYAARDWLKEKGIPEERIWTVIHTGVNTEKFFPLPGDLQIKIKFGIPEDHLLIVSVGRLHSSKGFEQLIKAMRHVTSRFPKVSLVIRGSGPQEQQLKDLVNKLKLQEHVKIIEKSLSRSELNELYNASDFAALASMKELFPNFSIIESLACGKPVIHSSLGGERDLGGDGYASYYVKYGDVEALAETMLFLVENSDVRKKMSRNALLLVNEEYKMSVVAAKLRKAYDFARKFQSIDP